MADETKKCRECQTDIPKKARRCPNCRAKQGIGLGGLLVAIISIGIISSVIMSSLGDSDSTVNTHTPTPQKTSGEPFSPTHYIDPTEFQNGSVRQVNVWQSYTDRTKVGELLGTHEVKLLERDEENNYCHVKNKKVNGWLSCDWLVEMEENTATPQGSAVNYQVIDEEDISYAGCHRVALRVVVPDSAAQVDVDYTLGQIISKYQSEWDDITVWAWGQSELSDVGNSMYTKGIEEYSTCN